MKILGIETSCDETSAAVVKDGTKLLTNVVATSSHLHANTGGIIPENAARQQVKYIIPVIDEALRKAFPKVSSSSPEAYSGEVDAIAVTVGPGLIGSLIVGIETAKTLSYLLNKPLIEVNHLVAHPYANWLQHDSKQKNSLPNTPEFPALSLVVSGGHTDLVLMKDHGRLLWLGGTRDDAAGEAFDKCARLLGLPYPGGPAISNAAEKYLERKGPKTKLDLFPRPLSYEDSLDFSFSGLKTAVKTYIDKFDGGNGSHKNQASRLAAEIQQAIVDSLMAKILIAVDRYSPKSFLLAGGVSANQSLRKKASEVFSNLYPRVKLHIPEVSLCTDNASYIASCAYFNYRPRKPLAIKALPQLHISDQL